MTALKQPNWGGVAADRLGGLVNHAVGGGVVSTAGEEDRGVGGVL